MRLNTFTLKGGRKLPLGWQRTGATAVLLVSVAAGFGAGNIVGGDERALWPLLCAALLALLGGIGLTGTP